MPSNLSSAAFDELLDTLAAKIAAHISQAAAPPPVDGAWLTTTDAAALLGLSVATLESWRTQSKGPAFHKLGRNVVRYKKADITAYLERDRRNSTSAPTRGARK